MAASSRATSATEKGHRVGAIVAFRAVGRAATIPGPLKTPLVERVRSIASRLLQAWRSQTSALAGPDWTDPPEHGEASREWWIERRASSRN
jgi:hypothetical protein